jgi:hypothetical protein
MIKLLVKPERDIVLFCEACQRDLSAKPEINIVLTAKTVRETCQRSRTDILYLTTKPVIDLSEEPEKDTVPNREACQRDVTSNDRTLSGRLIAEHVR